MKILAITHQYPAPHEPGFAPYNRQQWAVLARHHDLRIIRPVAWPARLQQLWTRHPIPVNPGIDVTYATYYYTPKIFGAHYGTFFEASVRSTVVRAIASFQPDVLLTCWAHPDGWAAARFGREAGLPVVLKVIGSDVLVLAKSARRRHVADALTGVSDVVAVSNDLAQRVIQLGASAERVHVVPEGISREAFSPGDQGEARDQLGIARSERLILFVGSLLRSKGAADLVQACARMRDQGARFECHLLGHGRDEASLTRLAHELQLSSRVHFHGPRPHTELASWYRAADVVTLPSYTEGIPNALREAIECGRPFVSTPVGGIPEIADPSFSLLVPPGDINALATALTDLLDRPRQVDRRIVERVNITWEQSGSLLAQHLQDAVDRRPNHSRQRPERH